MSELLRQAELLEGLESADLEALEAIAKERHLAEGEYLFLLGGDAERIYVVLQGALELCFPLSWRGALHDTPVDRVVAGAPLGWSALVKPYRFTLSARAAEPTETASFLRRDLLELFERRPRLGYVFMKRVAELVGSRYLKMAALWAREFQRAVAEAESSPRASDSDSKNLKALAERAIQGDEA